MAVERRIYLASITSSSVMSTGLSPRFQRALADAAGVVDQRDVERGSRSLRRREDAAGADRDLGGEGLHDAPVGEARADGGADAAMDGRRRDAAFGAEAFQCREHVRVGRRRMT